MSYVVAILECQFNSGVGWKDNVRESKEGQDKKSPEEDLACWKRDAKFLFKLLMGRLDLITHRVKLLERDRAANVECINAKFESVEASLERKIVEMGTDLLTSNLELISDSIFSEVKEIVARLPEEVVAQL